MAYPHTKSMEILMSIELLPGGGESEEEENDPLEEPEEPEEEPEDPEEEL